MRCCAVLVSCRAERGRARESDALPVDIERASERAESFERRFAPFVMTRERSSLEPRERGLSGEASVLLVGVEDALDGDDVGSGAQAGEVAFLEGVDECREGVLDDGFEFVVDAFF